MAGGKSEVRSVPVVRAVTYFLAHVPNMIRHGSKPSREISLDPSILDKSWAI